MTIALTPGLLWLAAWLIAALLIGLAMVLESVKRR